MHNYAKHSPSQLNAVHLDDVIQLFMSVKMCLRRNMNNQKVLFLEPSSPTWSHKYQAEANNLEKKKKKNFFD